MYGTDRYNLNRFVWAQDRPVRTGFGQYHSEYEIALAELRAGKKRGHWIWFVIPRLTGTSSMSQYYGLGNRWAARAYLKHPVLGPRLLRCVEAILAARGTLLEVFGDVDAAKVRQTAELFASLNVASSHLFLKLLCKV